MEGGGGGGEPAAGVAVEEALRIRRFEEPPAADHFASHIEPGNVPAVFIGAVKEWEALSKWDPRNGGLDYLEGRVGSAIVEAMLSRSAHIFYGDLRSHERVPLPFSTFITSCKLHLDVGKEGHLVGTQDNSEVAPVSFDDMSSTSVNTSNQLYLAQVPIMNIENKERLPLENLKEDIQMPTFLKMKTLASINLWMNNAHSRSSTHYDPHHNLLCVVAGCKTVFLWPPSATPLLYPMPVYGESSNHGSVDIKKPDLSVHSRAIHSMDYSQKAILHAGDALFIPEGWFHQVDSDDLTIAVNFWWQSNMMCNMLHHMDAYYLRRILNRLVDNEMNQIFCGSQMGRIKAIESCQRTNEASEDHSDSDYNGQRETPNRNVEKYGSMLCHLETSELHALHELVSLVHDSANVSGQNQAVQYTALKNTEVSQQGDHRHMLSLCAFEDDPVARVFLTLEPLVLQKVFLAMVHNFPRTLEALILHMLSPVAAEVLTRKFDEMDQQTPKAQQTEFYQLFYGVFDDQYAAMESILRAKELFAFLAFRNVLDQYLGVIVLKPE